MDWGDRFVVGVMLAVWIPAALFVADGFAWILLGHFVMFDWAAERVIAAFGVPFLVWMIAAGMHA